MKPFSCWWTEKKYCACASFRSWWQVFHDGTPNLFYTSSQKFLSTAKKEHRIVQTTQSMRRRKVDRGDRWLIKVPPDITTGRNSKEEEHLFLEKWRKNMSAALHPILKLAIDSFFMLCNMVVKIWCQKQRNIAFSCLVLVRGGFSPLGPDHRQMWKILTH